MGLSRLQAKIMSKKAAKMTKLFKYRGLKIIKIPESAEIILISTSSSQSIDVGGVD